MPISQLSFFVAAQTANYYKAFPLLLHEFPDIELISLCCNAAYGQLIGIFKEFDKFGFSGTSHIVKFSYFICLHDSDCFSQLLCKFLRSVARHFKTSKCPFEAAYTYLLF